MHCIYVYVYVCMYIYVCMYVYICMYVCTYVCMYVHVNVCISTLHAISSAASCSEMYVHCLGIHTTMCMCVYVLSLQRELSQDEGDNILMAKVSCLSSPSSDVFLC